MIGIDGDEPRVGCQLLHAPELRAHRGTDGRAAGEDELEGDDAAADHVAAQVQHAARGVGERDVRNVERGVVRHKVRHVRNIAPRAYGEGYRESYGYAYEPWTTGTYNGVNRWGGGPGSVW